MCRCLTQLAGVLALLIASPIAAEVLDAAPGGFTIRHVASIDAPRADVYRSMLGIGEWWSADHTVSGYAENLYLEPRTQGCFCERLGEGAGLVHLTVTFVNPGVMLRLTGGLGPLGLMGVGGNMTWEFEDASSGTAVTLTYAVGGYLPQGLDSIAAAVDGVLIEQLSRLQNYVETGGPTLE